MRAAIKLAGLIVSAAALAGLGLSLSSGVALAGSAWDEIRGSVFGTKAIEDGRGIVVLSAPNRPEDMRAVPIAIDAKFADGRTVKTVTFMIDENPTPVVAVFHMGAQRDAVSLKANFRVDRQSDVRAVVEANDGQLYMVSQLVKFAGGQASCSAPPQGDPAEIAANMGKMKFEEVASTDAATKTIARGKLTMNHPNHTGMVLDQITLLYTPLKIVTDVTAKSGDETLFTAEGSIGLSQNPQIEFDFKRNGAQELEVSFKDSDGGAWTKKFPAGPQS